MAASLSTHVMCSSPNEKLFTSHSGPPILDNIVGLSWNPPDGSSSTIALSAIILSNGLLSWSFQAFHSACSYFLMPSSVPAEFAIAVVLVVVVVFLVVFLSSAA